jgi:hypothetical protein
MADRLTRTVLPAALVAGLLLLLLWPTPRSGSRLLRTWGVPHPHPDQVAEAVRYLRQRRILYVVLFLVVPPLAGLVLRDDADLPGLGVLVPLLVAMLVAELLATLRPVSGVRVASLDPRSRRDLVPRWSLVAMAVLVAVTAAWSVLGLVAQLWADRYAAALPPDGVPQPPTGWTSEYSPEYRAEMTTSTSWLALGYAAAALVLVAVLVRLAVRRPAVADAAVDAALRTRTARVAVGIGLGWLGGAVLVAVGRVGFLRTMAEDRPPRALPAPPGWLTARFDAVGDVVGPVALLAGVLAWIWVATPTGRSLAAGRR